MVESLNSALRHLFAVFFHPLAGHSTLLSLAVTAALAAFLAMLVFDKVTNKPVRERAMRRLWTNLLAIRLFADDPSVVLRSLAGLAAANLQLLVCAIPALVVMVPLFFLVYGHLDAFFGSTPLVAGSHRVVTVRLAHLENGWPDVRLITPPWITVDSPPVHVFDEGEISWSIRPSRASRGALQVIAGNEAIEKVIDARPAPRYLSSARMQSPAGAMRYPGEARLPAGIITEVNVFDRPPMISCCGVALHWTWWFLILSLAFALPAKWVLSLTRR